MSKKPTPTLIDALYRESFRNQPIMNWRSNSGMREALVSARRFILDDAMSTFLGDLSTAAFVARQGYLWIDKSRAKYAEQLRVSARLPHKAVWFEYNLQKELARSNALLGNPYDKSISPKTEGVLLQQHPKLDTAIIMHLFSDVGFMDRAGCQFYTFPIAYTWTVNNEQSPWPSALGAYKNEEDGSQFWLDSQLATGIMGYRTPCVTIARESPLLESPLREDSDAVMGLIKDWQGCVRRIWALLATLNDIPSQMTEVRQSKGFVAKGRYRHFLDHRVLTLTIPQKAYTKIARNLIALVRRRAHQVRGHWRLDWRNPGNSRCDHQWQVDQTCSRCRAHRLWISEHQRGDASLGFVTHDYAVTHETEA